MTTSGAGTAATRSTGNDDMATDISRGDVPWTTVVKGKSDGHPAASRKRKDVPLASGTYKTQKEPNQTKQPDDPYLMRIISAIDRLDTKVDTELHTLNNKVDGVQRDLVAHKEDSQALAPVLRGIMTQLTAMEEERRRTPIGYGHHLPLPWPSIQTNPGAYNHNALPSAQHQIALTSYGTLPPYSILGTTPAIEAAPPSESTGSPHPPTDADVHGQQGGRGGQQD